MGRTNPTYRDWLRRTSEDLQPFRRALRQQYQTDFDRLFEHADQYADAAGYANRTTPEFSLLLSIFLGQQRELRRLQDQLDEAESVTAPPESDGV